MKRFRQILALLLLALMVPASVCCLLPLQTVDQECGCCSNADDGRDVPAPPEECPRHTIAESRVPAPVVLPAMQMIEVATIIEEMMWPDELAAAKATPLPLMPAAPPDLRTTWVFVSRAALPARAPSGLA